MERAAAFNKGYDDYPRYANRFEANTSLANFYDSGWETARMHESPAFQYKSDDYPYGERQPYKVKMLKTITSDIPYMVLEETAEKGEIYEVYTNSNGAMSVYLPSGDKLGIKPGEFEIVKFYEDGDEE